MDSTVESQDKQPPSSEGTVARLESEAESLRRKVSELEAVVIKQDGLKAELDESYDQVEALKEQVERMRTDFAEKSTLKEELAQKKERVSELEYENASLRRDLQGKTDLLGTCNAAKESAQKLADKCWDELTQRTAELEKARSLQKSTQDGYSSAIRSERDLRSKHRSEKELREATFNELIKEQKRCEEKEAEVRRLQASIGTKDEEIQTLKDSTQSKDQEIEQLVYQLGDRDNELESQKRSVNQLTADFDEARRGKADVELDLGLVIRLSTRATDVNVQDWAPLIHSLRDSAPIQISPVENMSAQVWAILPSWDGSPADEDTGLGSSELPCVPSSPGSLLFELFGHAMAERDIRCSQCLRSLAALSAQVGRHGVTKVSSFVIVLEKLVARIRRLEAVSGYQGMMLLGLKYLASLVRSRVPDAPGLAAVEDSLNVMMEQANESLGVIRHVSHALCVSGDIETTEADWALCLSSTEGRSLMLLAEPRHPDELFLLADLDNRTVRAVSCERCEINVMLNEARDDFIKSAVIKAPTDQPDIELVLTDEENDWMLEHL